MLTHCNAGWLATVDVGTATAPIYLAHDKGIPLHVLVDETRPRNQGASLTAWELGQPWRAAHRDPRQHRRPPDAARPGRHRHRRHRPRHRQRRRLQQDRHLSEGAGGEGQRRAVLCGAAVADHRFFGGGRLRRDSDRAAQRRRGRDRVRPHRRWPHRDGAHRSGRLGGRQLRLRRDAGAARDRADHRARGGVAIARSLGQGFPGAGRRGKDSGPRVLGVSGGVACVRCTGPPMFRCRGSSTP